MFKYYLFDLDGTISQSEPGIFNCIRYAFEKAGLDCPGEDVMKTFIGPTLYDSFTKTCGFTHEDANEMVRLYRERYEKVGLFETAIYDGIEETLAALKSRGAKLAVATSKPIAPTLRILEKFGLDAYFDVVSATKPEDVDSDKARIIKAALDEFQSTNEAEDVKAFAVMIGDRKFDILGAKACGISSIGVLFGYGSAEEFAEAGADYVVEKATDILEL